MLAYKLFHSVIDRADGVSADRAGRGGRAEVGVLAHGGVLDRGCDHRRAVHHDELPFLPRRALCAPCLTIGIR